MEKLKLSFKDDGYIPNSRFPVILTFGAMVNLRGKNVVEAEAEADLKERALKTGWNLEWLWKVYKRPHYHSTTHEALVVYRGWANLRLGGHRLGQVVLVSPGDTIVIPAGVAHQAVDRTDDFQVFGFYPISAKPWDLLFCRKKEREIALPNLALHSKPPTFRL